MPKGRYRTRFFIMLGVFVAFVLALLVLPVLLPFNPNATDLSRSLLSPGQEGAPLGTDSMGRDVFIRTLSGGSESVLIGFEVLALVALIGSIVGVAAGYFGGKIDYILSRIITAFQAFPGFVLAVAIAGVLGQGMGNMIFALAAVYWTQFARLVRSIVISFKKSDCLMAARMCGAKSASIIRKYFAPEIIGPVCVMAALSMSDIILTMAGLSFIGLGPARPTNEWGTMMAEAQPSFQYAIWCMLVPMAALFVAVIIFNLLGDTLRDALDAKHASSVSDAREPRINKRLKTFVTNIGKEKGKSANEIISNEQG